MVSFPTEKDAGILIHRIASRALAGVRPLSSFSPVELTHSLVADVLDAAATATSGLLFNAHKISGTSS